MKNQKNCRKNSENFRRFHPRLQFKYLPSPKLIVINIRHERPWHKRQIQSQDETEPPSSHPRTLIKQEQEDRKKLFLPIISLTIKMRLFKWKLPRKFQFNINVEQNFQMDWNWIIAECWVTSIPFLSLNIVLGAIQSQIYSQILIKSQLIVFRFNQSRCVSYCSNIDFGFFTSLLFVFFSEC